MQEALAELLGGDMTEEQASEASEPEDIRREAIREIGELQQRLEELLDGDQAKLDAALKQSLAGRRATA